MASIPAIPAVPVASPMVLTPIQQPNRSPFAFSQLYAASPRTTNASDQLRALLDSADRMQSGSTCDGVTSDGLSAPQVPPSDTDLEKRMDRLEGKLNSLEKQTIQAIKQLTLVVTELKNAQ